MKSITGWDGTPRLVTVAVVRFEEARTGEKSVKHGPPGRSHGLLWREEARPLQSCREDPGK